MGIQRESPPKTPKIPKAAKAPIPKMAIPKMAPIPKSNGLTAAPIPNAAPIPTVAPLPVPVTMVTAAPIPNSNSFPAAPPPPIPVTLSTPKTAPKPKTAPSPNSAKSALDALFASKTKPADDPMAKYLRMKKMKIPMDSIKNKMAMDGIDKIQIAKFAGEPVASDAMLNGIDLSAYDLTKYEKMKKMKIPMNGIKNKMKMDGVDSKVIATFFGEKLADSNGDSAGAKVMEPPSAKPDMAKYERMKVSNFERYVRWKVIRFCVGSHCSLQRKKEWKMANAKMFLL